MKSISFGLYDISKIKMFGFCYKQTNKKGKDGRNS